MARCKAKHKKERLHLPFELLSDARRELVNALRLPTFEVGGMTLVKRLTLIVNHIGHAIEESLWAVLMLILSAALEPRLSPLEGPLRIMLIAGLLVYGAGAGLTMAFDVRTYVRRWRLNAAGVHLPLATGLRDSQRRRHPTVAWEIWREEVPWMTLYFSIGVWRAWPWCSSKDRPCAHDSRRI